MKIGVEFEIELCGAEETGRRPGFDTAVFQRYLVPGFAGHMYVAKVTKAPPLGVPRHAAREMLIGQRVGRAGVVRQLGGGYDILGVGMIVNVFVEGVEDGEL